jgi:ribonuclease HI
MSAAHVAPLELYSDGSAEDRSMRPGGWAFVIVRGDEVLATGQGSAAKTTSLVMELEAACAALTGVLSRGWHAGTGVVLISDCSVALDVAAGRFLPRPPQYAELCRALRQATLEAGATTRWVRAHAGHRWNEHVDALAEQARAARVALIAEARLPRTRSRK